GAAEQRFHGRFEHPGIHERIEAVVHEGPQLALLQILPHLPLERGWAIRAQVVRPKRDAVVQLDHLVERQRVKQWLDLLPVAIGRRARAEQSEDLQDSRHRVPLLPGPPSAAPPLGTSSSSPAPPPATATAGSACTNVRFSPGVKSVITSSIVPLGVPAPSRNASTSTSDLGSSELLCTIPATAGPSAYVVHWSGPSTRTP